MNDNNLISILNNNDLVVNFDDFGFDDIIERGKNKIELTEQEITLNVVKDLLFDLNYTKYSNVYKGYGSASKLMDNTIAYGFERFAVFIEYNKNFIVKNIWLNQENDLNIDNTGKNLLMFLFNLGLTFKLILVDWSEEIVIRLENKEKIKEYLNTSYYFDIQ
jgi:pyruvate carboxylase